MDAVAATELLASGEVGGQPVGAAALDEEVGVLPVHVAVHGAADHRTSSSQVLEDLRKGGMLVETIEKWPLHGFVIDGDKLV